MASIDDLLKSLSRSTDADISFIGLADNGGDSIDLGLVPVGLGCGETAMEDEELFEDEEGAPDLSLDRHIANVKFTKDW